jgi:hypothetical protein
MRRFSSLALLGTLALLGAGAACADDNKAPSPVPPPAVQTPGSDEAKSGSSEAPGSLSDKLSNSGGVIRPPAGIDPEMKQHTPPTGTQSMPVVPPPGTPGGDQTVKPK